MISANAETETDGPFVATIVVGGSMAMAMGMGKSMQRRRERKEGNEAISKGY